MKTTRSKHFPPLLFKGVFLLLIILFFLSVGAESAGHIQVRMILTGILCGSFIVFFRYLSDSFKPGPSTYAFLAILIFEIVRAVAAGLHVPGFDPDTLKNGLYIKSILIWGTYFVGFFAVVSSANRKSFSLDYLKINAAMAFLISMMIIPQLLRTGNQHIVLNNKYYFFYPALYFKSWVGDYLLTPYSHSNRTGDIIAIGFFSSLGLLFYSFLQFKERIKTAISYLEKPNAQEWSTFFLYIAASFVMGAGILLLFSRGTISSCAIVFLVYFFAISLKFPSKTQWFFLFFILATGGLFFSWAGNLNKAWKEIQTLKVEKEAMNSDLNQEKQKSRSIYMTQEGIKRSLRIYKKYPVWGVGTNGYKQVAGRYSSGGEYDSLTIPKFTAMCHYLQLLAEEGMGAFLYYIFLILYFIELSWGLIRTQSQFKFVAAISFAAPALSILIHSSFIEMMQRFNVAMPVYLLMGAALAVLRKDFQHDA